MPERLAPPDVPDPGDEALVEERVADLAAGFHPQARDDAFDVERQRKDVRPERQGSPRGELEPASSPEHALRTGPRSTSHGKPRTAVERGCTRQLPRIPR